MQQLFRMTAFVFALLSLWLAEFILPASAAGEMHMVPVLAQPLARGDVIGGASLVLKEMKLSPAGIDYITSSETLTGMAAKRPLRAGVPLRFTDITQPKIISKGDLVTIAFEAPGINLSIRGKALEDGVLRQSIRVVNTQTSRTFEGVAAAAGYVLVSPMTSPAPAAQQASRIEYSQATTALPGQ